MLVSFTLFSVVGYFFPLLVYQCDAQVLFFCVILKPQRFPAMLSQLLLISPRANRMDRFVSCFLYILIYNYLK